MRLKTTLNYYERIKLKKQFSNYNWIIFQGLKIKKELTQL
jgi:hypothetical protein